jgi:hypothetical protein
MMGPVEASEVGTKRPPPALQPRLIDWATLGWPVHDRYEVATEEEPLYGEPRTRVRPRGRHVTWHPVRDHEALYELLKPLATAHDQAIVQWITEHGLVGVDPRRPTRLGETTHEIREAVTAYMATARTLVAARRDRRRLPELLRALQLPVDRLLRVEVVAAQGVLLPVIASYGPLAAAYQQLLGAASLDESNSDDRPQWRTARECAHCGNLFRPRRKLQAFCKANCRKRHHDRLGA